MLAREVVRASAGVTGAVVLPFSRLCVAYRNYSPEQDRRKAAAWEPLTCPRRVPGQLEPRNGAKKIVRGALNSALRVAESCYASSRYAEPRAHS